MKLVVYTHPNDVRAEMDVINQLFREGLDELHIRKHGKGTSDIARMIDKIAPEYHSRIALHSAYSLVLDYDIDRIHIDEEWRGNFLLKQYLNRIVMRGKNVYRSTTIKSCKPLSEANNDVDEIILGPVFARASATISNLVFKKEVLAKALNKSIVPVLGYGGISTNTLDFMHHMPFSGVILQTAVWKALDPIRAFTEMRDYSHSLSLQKVG